MDRLNNWLVCACFFLLVIGGGSCMGMTLEEKIGTVQAYLAKNEMTSANGPQIAKDVAVGWCKEILSQVLRAEGITVRFQNQQTSFYDGVSIAFVADNTEVLTRQTFGVILVAFQNQPTTDLDNAALAALISSLSSVKLNNVTDRTFSFAVETDGFKVFQMTTATGKQTEDWRDDIIALVRGQTVYFLTSKKRPEGETASDVDTSPKQNAVWFSVLDNGKKKSD